MIRIRILIHVQPGPLRSPPAAGPEPGDPRPAAGRRPGSPGGAPVRGRDRPRAGPPSRVLGGRLLHPVPRQGGAAPSLRPAVLRGGAPALGVPARPPALEGS